MGEAPEAIVLVETRAEAETRRAARSFACRLHHADHASIDDVREIVETLRRSFPAIHEPAKDDICYATQNRQNAVKELAKRARTVLVVGAPASSNANRLVEVARAHGADAYLIESAEDIQPRSGSTATSASPRARRRPRTWCRPASIGFAWLGDYRLEEFRLVEERVMFPLPGELLAVARGEGRVGRRRQRARGRARARRARPGVPDPAPLVSH